MKLLISFILFVCLPLAGCSTYESRSQCAPSWTQLFNGQDLTGWTSEGDVSAWGVEDGELVTVKPGEGWWLRTDKMYRDFELKLDFWMPEGGNSGVGLRGSSNGDPAFTGFEVQILDTHNQAPGLRNCGAVYEAIAPETMAVLPSGKWNSYRIRVQDNTLNVWLNGIQIHLDQALDARGFYRDEDSPLPLNARASTGYISLQDHGHPFRYKNIWIRDLSPDPEPVGMVHLIDDELKNWFSEDNAEWSNEQGTLVGRKGPGHLFTKESYTDFEMRALVRVNDHGNSGMYFRVTPNPDPNNPWPNGYEAQVDQHDPKNYTGCIYNKAWPTTEPGKLGPLTKDNAWFDYRIRAQGDHIQTWINGVPMVDAQLSEFESGHLAVQGHHDSNVIEYRDIRVIELD
jgi:3-keto-disaccharide hydrolase